MTIEHSNPHFTEVFRVLTVLHSLPAVQEEQLLSLQRFIEREATLTEDAVVSDLGTALLAAIQEKDLSKALSLLKEEISLSSLPFIERRFSQQKKALIEISFVEQIKEIADDERDAAQLSDSNKDEEQPIETKTITEDSAVVSDEKTEQLEKEERKEEPKEETNVSLEQPKKEKEEPPEQKPAFDNSLRKYLFRRFRKEQRERGNREVHRASRREFWSEQCGGRALKELEESECVRLLEEQGIVSFADLLLLVPNAYHRIASHPIQTDMPAEMVTIRAKIIQKYIAIDSLMKRWVIVLEGKDGTHLFAKWVGSAPRGWDDWSISNVIGIAGLAQLEDSLEMINAEPVGLAGRGSGILSTYGLDGFEDRDIRDLLAKVLQCIQGQVQDSLPKEIVDAAGVISLDDALREVHFPSNINYTGRHRMAFEEVFLYNVGKRLTSELEKAQGLRNSILHAGLARLSYEKQIILNDEQERVFSEIRRDLFSRSPMRRILQGDVGAGKPMIALLSAISILRDDVLVVYVCEDELSVERRHQFAQSLLKMLSISTYTLREAPNRAQFDALKKQGGLVFVTKNVLSSKLQSLNVRLVIMEETHDFGRSFNNPILRSKPIPDLLVLTPTPMPIIALETMYIDLDISLIPTTNIVMPKCTFLSSKFRSQAYASLLEQVQEGRQGFIVLPSKEGKDLMGVKETLQMACALNAELLPGVRIGVYCSGMNTDERIKVFEDFQARRIDVLLCSTIIEENPLVGNVSWMIVEMAERFSTLRLHRLRGYLGNSHYASTCQFILSQNPLEEDVQRISMVCREYDGFVLTEKIGAEDFPTIEYRWLENHERKLRMLARSLARSLSIRDIRRVRWPLLQNAIVKRWGEEFSVATKGRNYRKRRPRGKRGK